MRLSRTALLPAMLLATPLAAQERVLTLGRPVQGELLRTDPIGRARRSPYHVWIMEGRRGQRVSFELSSSDFDAYLSVRDAEGYLIGSDDDSGEGTDSRVRAILPRDGRYRVIVTAFRDSSYGRYTLSAAGWEAPNALPAGAVGSIAVGQTREGLIEPGDEVAGDGPFQDRWTFEARAGQRLRLELGSEDFDAFLLLFGPGGELLATNDDTGEGRDSRISFRAAASGRYTAVATSYGENLQTGVYRIALLEETGDFADPGVAVRIAPGETRDGRLETGDRTGARGLEDRWTFTGRAGQLARVDVKSPDFDAYATLELAGVALDSNDDGGSGNDARLMTVLSRDGEYAVIVSAYSGSGTGGRYSVSLVFAEPPSPPGRAGRLTAGRVVSGRLEEGDRRRSGGGLSDLWEFEGRAGQEVTIELRSGDFDAYLELRDPRGSLVAENDDGGEGTDSFISTRLPAGGRYQVVARSYGDAERTGFYELVLTVGGASAAPGSVAVLQLGAQMVGRLEAGDSVMGDETWADVYTFRAPREGTLSVEMRSSDFDAYLIVKDEEGRTLGTDDDGAGGTDARLGVRVAAGRTYRVYANSYGSERSTGSYRLTARLEP